MATIGLSAALEQFHPNELLEHCRLAEQYGFRGVMAADHFQPWVPAQGHNAFVYSWMGALGVVTNHRFGPGVTCPSFRTHPAVIAQAAATLGAMFPGRFWLGLGSGELLNENVVGGEWPEPLVRFEMLQEATEIIQKLLSGKETRYRGRYFRMNKVRLWTLPEEPVPIYIAATGPQTLRWAGRTCDGLITPGLPPTNCAASWPISPPVPAKPEKTPIRCPSCCSCTSRGRQPMKRRCRMRLPNGQTVA